MPSLDAPSHLVDDPGVDLLYLCSSETARHYLLLLAASGSVGVARFAEQPRLLFFKINLMGVVKMSAAPSCRLCVSFVSLLFLGNVY